jgi:hypothetical protein
VKLVAQELLTSLPRRKFDILSSLFGEGCVSDTVTAFQYRLLTLSFPTIFTGFMLALLTSNQELQLRSRTQAMTTARRTDILQTRLKNQSLAESRLTAEDLLLADVASFTSAFWAYLWRSFIGIE